MIHEVPCFMLSALSLSGHHDDVESSSQDLIGPIGTVPLIHSMLLEFRLTVFVSFLSISSSFP